MKVEALFLFSADRAGVHLAIIEIDFQITQRNDIDKSYSLVAIDYTINDHITIAIRNSMPGQCVCNILIALEEEIGRKNYIKSYEGTIIKERTFFYGYIWTYRI
jgi:hypothetical protein